MIKTDSFSKVEITSVHELRDWLTENHKLDQGVWLVTYKKNEGAKYVSREEVLDELLCFGWIDGIRRKLDEKKTMQLITKRRAQHWSKTYKDRASKLIEQGKMHDAGLEAISISKSSGLWNFMDDVDNLIIPEDLYKELSKIKEALQFFDSINPSSKRFVLRWVKLAKTENTRKIRIQKLVELSLKGEKLPGS
ncbi:YdeI/OmpD-associated family protein [Flavobacteriaceae bacterium]|nr:YdeI/OmpD-associated family protein [Flavobacteriaceae bacterium]MDB2632457.1 YdeI/OmpD-associated family protein [Flavobacteriaceae bacterium]